MQTQMQITSAQPRGGRALPGTLRLSLVLRTSEAASRIKSSAVCSASVTPLHTVTTGPEVPTFTSKVVS